MLVGREAERAQLDALLDRTRSGQGGALVLRGEPGSGKSTLLRYAEEEADGMRALHARGVETEAELAYSGLHELLRPLLELLPEIPELQSDALRGALRFAQAEPTGLTGSSTSSQLRQTPRDGPGRRPEQHTFAPSSTRRRTHSRQRLDSTSRQGVRSRGPGRNSRTGNGCAVRVAASTRGRSYVPRWWTLERLGAEPWAEQARAELRATGERVRRRTTTALGELTSHELQVALVVRRGATNKEAAAQLYLSPKTIEKHLGSVYRKLGVRFRTELAAVFASSTVDEAAAG
jgi:DNA-binding CsgD family transcriptional regulator